MLLRFTTTVSLGLALAACGPRGSVELDIAEVGTARSAAVPPAPNAPSVPLDVELRAGPLRAALDAGATFELALFDCRSPAAVGETVPLTFGGEPIASISGSQLSDDPDMLVQLSAAVPGSALASAQPCARLVRAGGSGPDIVSRAVPLRK